MQTDMLFPCNKVLQMSTDEASAPSTYTSKNCLIWKLFFDEWKNIMVYISSYGVRRIQTSVQLFHLRLRSVVKLLPRTHADTNWLVTAPFTFESDLPVDCRRGKGWWGALAVWTSWLVSKPWGPTTQTQTHTHTHTHTHTSNTQQGRAFSLGWTV